VKIGWGLASRAEIVKKTLAEIYRR